MTRWWNVATSRPDGGEAGRGGAEAGRAGAGEERAGGAGGGAGATSECGGARAGGAGGGAGARSDVLYYLGYGGQPIAPELEERIEEMAKRCEKVARPAVVTRTFPSSEELRLPGEDIAHHLAGSVEVVLFAATLGHGVDRELRRLALVDPLGQVLFDAVATAAVERLANKTEAGIRKNAAARGLYCSWRFSPGYGDLPLDVQPGILARLDAARRLGITLTASNLMVPTKSVTAIVGVHPSPQPGLASSCAVCQLAEFCDGIRCRQGSA